MKNLALFILSFCLLINAKVAMSNSSLSFVQTVSHPLEAIESEINNILIPTHKSDLKDIDIYLDQYMALTKLYLRIKAYNLTLSQALLLKIQNHNTFSGDDLFLIKRSFDLFFNLNNKMINYGKHYKVKSGKLLKTLKDGENRIPLLKSHLIWISAHLLMIDQVQSIHQYLYEEQNNLRRIVKNIIGDKDVDIEGEEKLRLLTKQINTIVGEVENKRFIQQIILIHKIYPELENVFKNDLLGLFLLETTRNNEIFKQIVDGKRHFPIRAHIVEDAAVRYANKVTNFLSGFFGNIAGSIKWRKGYFYNNNTALKLAKNNLRPMDVILEKSPFVITDKFIPGHFGHVALYLGTKEQLLEHGLWLHPNIAPFHHDIENGKIILEAVRSGLRLNTLENFLNIDEMVIMRKSDALDSVDTVIEQLTRGLDQIGKSYDFNFDISTIDKVVCSELIYMIYGAVKWPTVYRVGRPTVTPDDISEILFYKNSKFKFHASFYSEKRHTIEVGDIDDLARELDYELRDQSGDEVSNPEDPNNSYWKKETKCYNVTEQRTDFENGEGGTNYKKRVCKTTYKEFYYEELARPVPPPHQAP